MILYRSEFSIGKSILQVGPYDPSKPIDREGPDNLIEIVVNQGLKRVFLVEDSLAGFIPIYKELLKHKIDMCFGWRVSIVEDVLSEEPQPESKIIIFARNEKGWKKLIKLGTYAQTTGKLKEPRLDYKKLHELYDDNLVIVIPFYDSFIHKNLMTKNACVPDFRGLPLFFFKESNDVIFDGLIQDGIANFGGKTIEAKSVYYRNREDAEIFQARKLMERKTYGSGSNVESPNLDFFMSDEFCVESALERKFEINEEFEALFNEPLRLFLPGIRLPEFVLSDEDKKRCNVPENASNIEILRLLARAGYKHKVEEGFIPKERAQEYADRVNYELDILEKTHFTDYILMVWRLVDFSRRNNLPIGKGRGSCAGSLVNYLIGITDVDSIEQNLFFERFINPSRAKINKIGDQIYLENLADIDTDFGGAAKERCIEFLQELYKGKFCKTATFGTYATKSIVKSAMKIVGGFSEDDTKPISNEVNVIFGKNDSPEKTYEQSEKFRAFMDANPKVYKAARKLQNGISNISSHASAYLVSSDLLEDTFPVELSDSGELLSSCDMSVSENMVIKLDLLGLHTVSLLKNAALSAGVDLDRLDYNDPEVYKYLQKLEHPAWLFQISGEATTRGLNKIQPKCLDHLVAVISLSRPGAFVYLDQYADYINGKTEIPSLHPLFDEMLKPYGGICYLQELLMEMFVKIGFSLTESDTLRKIVGKKKKEEIAEWEEKIYKRAEENGIDKKAAEVVWGIANASADYSFNKSLMLDTIVLTATGPKMMKNVNIGEEILSYNVKTNYEHFVKVIDIDIHKAVLWEFFTEDKQSIQCSMDHKFLTADGMLPIRDIFYTDKEVITIHGKTKVVSAAKVGEMDSIDFEVDHEDHNFYANGWVTSNSHAVSYSMMSFASVMLKFLHPQDFFTEALKLCQEKQEPIEEISALVREMPHFGLKLLPPDLIKSDIEFKKEGKDGIRYGLSSIKSVAQKSISKIQEFIDKDRATIFSLFQSAKQAKLNSTVFLALIETGTMDELSTDRQRIGLAWRIYSQLTPRESQYCLTNGEKYNYDMLAAMKDFLNWKDSSGKAIGKESRLETLRKKCEPYFQIYKENSKTPNLSEYLHEKALLGFSQHQLRNLFTEQKNLMTIQEIKEKLYEKDKFRAVVEVLKVTVGTAKKSEKKYCKMELADETGVITAGLFGDSWGNYAESHKAPEEGQILFITGTKGPDILWLNSINEQFLEIFMRVRDLKKLEKKEVSEDAEIISVENVETEKI